MDASNNAVSGYTGTVHFTSTDPQADLPANYKFTSADHGTHTFDVTLKTAGSQSITAIDTVTSTIIGSKTGIIIIPANLDHFDWSNIGPQTAGSAFTAIITAKDAYDNKTTKDTNGTTFVNNESVTFTTNAHVAADGTSKPTYAGANLTAGSEVTVTVNLTSGSFVTSNIILYNASETPNITIKHNGKTGTSNNIMVNPAKLDHFDWSNIGPQTAGNSFTATIAAKDAYENITTKDNDGSLFTHIEKVTFTTNATAPSRIHKPTYDGDNLLDGETVKVDLASGSFRTQDIVLYNMLEKPTLTITHDGKTGISNKITVNAPRWNSSDWYFYSYIDWSRSGSQIYTAPLLRE
jgi:hypothetical protein